ncbi:MAG TPA: hypothetical protein VNZ49_17685 [Bacteroidia bacterium]|jgi:hypothetical protein|nr:hypothetical protein [Bacteroidia bacterium]
MAKNQEQNYKLKSLIPYWSRWNWADIIHKRNTKQGYLHKQDLTSVFSNAYIQIEMKVIPMFERSGQADFEGLENEIFEFRKHFKVEGRVSEIVYYDDLILLLIQKLKTSSKNLNQEKKIGFKLEQQKFEKIGDLFSVLKDKKLVASKTTLLRFKKVFKGDEIKNKIQWVGSITALHHFIKGITLKNQKGKWKTACNCFYKDGYELNYISFCYSIVTWRKLKSRKYLFFKYLRLMFGSPYETILKIISKFI